MRGLALPSSLACMNALIFSLFFQTFCSYLRGSWEERQIRSFSHMNSYHSFQVEKELLKAPTVFLGNVEGLSRLIEIVR